MAEIPYLQFFVGESRKSWYVVIGWICGQLVIRLASDISGFHDSDEMKISSNEMINLTQEIKQLRWRDESIQIQSN